MKRSYLMGAAAWAVLLASSLASGAAQAAIVANGSFESGFTGWTPGGTSTDPFPPVVIPYNSGRCR